MPFDAQNSRRRPAGSTHRDQVVVHLLQPRREIPDEPAGGGSTSRQKGTQAARRGYSPFQRCRLERFVWDLDFDSVLARECVRGPGQACASRAAGFEV